MTKYEIIKKICESKGTSITAVATKAGLSTALPPAWKNGRDIRYDQLAKLAKALDIPLENFMFMIVNGEVVEPELADTVISISEQGTTNKPMIDFLKAQYSQATNADEAEILNFYRSLSRKDQHRFMVMVYDFKESEEV